MFTVITPNLYRRPKSLTLSRTIQILENEDVYISSDYHFKQEINQQQTTSAFDKAVQENKRIFAMHNDCVKPGDYVLFLGDISEKELIKSEHIAQLWKMCNLLHGQKIMVKGNNDNFDNEFYAICGFQYVADSELIAPNRKLIFTHEPIDLQARHLEQYLNLHGHIHGSKTYWHIDWRNHIDVYHGLHKGKVLKLSEYLHNFKKGYYNGETVQRQFGGHF